MAATPNLDAVRAGIQRLLSSGVEPAKVHDTYIATSIGNANAYARAMHEYAHTPRLVTEGHATFRSGAGSAGGRRSISGFKAFLEAREGA
jgi:hypothetical protein